MEKSHCVNFAYLNILYFHQLNKKHMKNYIFIILLFVSILGSAQKFEYSTIFEGIGDNREYFSGKAQSQTILGARGAFEIGTSIDGHKLRAGLSELSWSMHHACVIDKNDVDLLIEKLEEHIRSNDEST